MHIMPEIITLQMTFMLFINHFMTLVTKNFELPIKILFLR